eukprot:1853489-Alexandrium_andersonii.AAC.1
MSVRCSVARAQLRRNAFPKSRLQRRGARCGHCDSATLTSRASLGKMHQRAQYQSLLCARWARRCSDRTWSGKAAPNSRTRSVCNLISEPRRDMCNREYGW